MKADEITKLEQRVNKARSLQHQIRNAQGLLKDLSAERSHYGSVLARNLIIQFQDQNDADHRPYCFEVKKHLRVAIFSVIINELQADLAALEKELADL